jgi:hypothetical protein
MCFLPWAALAVIVWVAACVMYLLGHPLARPLGFAMAATFPAVFLFQIIAGVVDAVILLLAALIASRHTRIGDAIFPWLLLLTVIVMFVMSVVGFCEGWRVGWACGKGYALGEAVLERPLVRLALRACPFLFCRRRILPPWRSNVK